jgi:hypothetical protein
MKDFEFYNSTRIIFGKGKTTLLGELTYPYGRRVLLVYGQASAKRKGLLEIVKMSLDNAGIEYVECGGVKSNPVVSFVRSAIDLVRKMKLEAIVAVGGGSVIDTAKAIAAGVHYQSDVWDFFAGTARVLKAMPITVVLTLAASASEMNDGGVITNEETQQKFGFGGEALLPKVSILDPMNTFSVPVDYTMYGAVDAIVHALEGYFNSSDPDTPFQDRFVESLVLTIKEAAETLLTNPVDYNARANLMWCATLALNGLTTAGVGVEGYPMHMIEHSLSALYDIPHGAGLAIVTPAWMRYHSTRSPERFALFADKIFCIRKDSVEEQAKIGIDSFEQWLRTIGTPTRLRDVGIPTTDITKIAENAVMLAQRWNLKNYTKEVISQILSLA